MLRIFFTVLDTVVVRALFSKKKMLGPNSLRFGRSPSYECDLHISQSSFEERLICRKSVPLNLTDFWLAISRWPLVNDDFAVSTKFIKEDSARFSMAQEIQFTELNYKITKNDLEYSSVLNSIEIKNHIQITEKQG